MKGFEVMTENQGRIRSCPVLGSLVPKTELSAGREATTGNLPEIQLSRLQAAFILRAVPSTRIRKINFFSGLAMG